MASNPMVSKQAATIKGATASRGSGARPQQALGRPGGAARPGQVGTARSNVAGTKKR